MGLRGVLRKGYSRIWVPPVVAFSSLAMLRDTLPWRFHNDHFYVLTIVDIKYTGFHLPIIANKETVERQIK